MALKVCHTKSRDAVFGVLLYVIALAAIFSLIACASPKWFTRTVFQFNTKSQATNTIVTSLTTNIQVYGGLWELTTLYNDSEVEDEDPLHFCDRWLTLQREVYAKALTASHPNTIEVQRELLRMEEGCFRLRKDTYKSC
jgi:hypothetical protein